MKFHHIGYVVSSIIIYEQHILFSKKVKQVFDPIQDADIGLYENFSGGYIELIEPKSDTAFTYNVLKKRGNGYHHLCYEVETVDEMNYYVNKHRMLLIKGPLKAVLFNDCNVYFYYSRNKEIIEFVVL